MSCAALAVLAPAGAAAYAKVEAPPQQSGVSGLPDGRVYEEASPPNKYGNEVLVERPAFAAVDGQAVAYAGSGALAEASSNSPFDAQFVSERTGHGWVTRSATPLPEPGPEGAEEYVTAGARLTLDVPSADLSHLLFGTWNHSPFAAPPDEGKLTNNVYLEGPDPFAEPEWIGRPQIEGPPGGPGGTNFTPMFIAGVSPDLKTIYFYYGGSLMQGASHLYEYSEGVLSDSGALPGGETSAGAAVPAAQEAKGSGEDVGLISPAGFDNQVSADGSRLFFTREDEAGTLELYARVTAADGSQRTLLVSQSQLPGHAGEPAPDGPVAMPSTEWLAEGSLDPEHGGSASSPSYVFASPDGSHAFFQSSDRLTETAPEDGAVKAYDFDLETGSLEYLPALTGSIVTVSNDGSSLVFESTATSPFELDRWTSGPGGGSVMPIAQLPAASPNVCGAVLCVGPAYTSSDGEIVTFTTEAPIPGFNDGGSHTTTEGGNRKGPFPNKEVFRYDAMSDALSCISCPPAGVVPTHNAVISKLTEQNNFNGATGGPIVMTPGRGMSADGSRIFFETPEALVSQDVNGVSDVYEWENGSVFLISSGRSSEGSYFADASESGSDVFFTTSEGIALGDTDGGYDVYDARIPRPGDNPPPEALPCAGDVCQGPPSVPNLLSAPPSATFNGVGNLASRFTGPVAKSKAKKTGRAGKRRRAERKRTKARRARRAKRKRAKARKAQSAKRKKTGRRHKALHTHAHRRHDNRRGE